MNLTKKPALPTFHLVLKSFFLFQFLFMSFVFATESLEMQIRNEINQRYTNSKIEFIKPIELDHKIEFDSARLISLKEANAGNISIVFQDKQGVLTHAQTQIKVLIDAFIAKKRIFPTDALKSEDFSVSVINLMDEKYKDLKGLTLPTKGTLIDGMQSKLSILEGMPLLYTQVQKTPSVKRGDWVQLVIRSGEITLSTQGIAQEPALLNQNIRVFSQKNKKELVGVLKENQTVEVSINKNQKTL